MRYVLVCLVLGALSGCGSSEPPPPPEKTVFDPMTSQIDKVKEQAETLPVERKGNLDDAIDADSN